MCLQLVTSIVQVNVLIFQKRGSGLCSKLLVRSLIVSSIDVHAFHFSATPQSVKVASGVVPVMFIILGVVIGAYLVRRYETGVREL